MALLALPFIGLVIWDMVLTYRILRSGRGHEKKYWQINFKFIIRVKFKLPTLMGVCIDHPLLTVFITLLGILLILLITWETPKILLIPIAAFGYACRRSWRILHG